MAKVKKDKDSFVKLFVPELKEIVGGDEKTWLMTAQLEYWFGLYPDKFYKFMNPPKEPNRAYKVGQSWTEEMGLSGNKIDNALKPICTRYKSYAEYRNQEGDKFKDNFYLSYYHKPSHLTFYLRNHDKVNEALASLSLENTSKIFKPKYSSKVGKETTSTSGDWETNFPEDVENTVPVERENSFPELQNITPVYTETTTKTTSENKTYSNQRKSEEASLYQITLEEKNGIYEEIASLDNVKKNFDFSKTDFPAFAGLAARGGEAAPFPADFQLTEEIISWAKAKNPRLETDEDVINSLDVFLEYNRGIYKNDWEKPLRMWLKKEKNPKTVYPKKPSQVEAYRKCLNYFGDGETSNIFSNLYGDEKNSTYKEEATQKSNFDVANPVETKPSKLDINKITNSVAQEILKFSYHIKPYVIHVNNFYSGLNNYSETEIDEGLEYLYKNKIFLRYSNYFYNNSESVKSEEWKNLVIKELDPIKKDFIDSHQETLKKIIVLVTDNILLWSGSLYEEFPEIDKNGLVKLVSILIHKKKELVLHEDYLFNKNLYDSDSNYKDKVDTKFSELNLSEYIGN